MLSFFKSNREQFERLARMLHTEKQGFEITGDTGVADLQASGIPRARASTYLRMRTKLHLVWIKDYGNGDIEYCFSSMGFVTHGSEKGFLFSEHPEDRTIMAGSLDQFSKKGYGTAQMPISNAPGWYLYYRGF